MKTAQKQACKRLLKKLSALRATLSNSERAILDDLMGVDPVTAHKLSGQVTTGSMSMRISFEKDSEEYKIQE